MTVADGNHLGMSVAYNNYYTAKNQKSYNNFYVISYSPHDQQLHFLVIILINVILIYSNPLFFPYNNYIHLSRSIIIVTDFIGYNNYTSQDQRDISV